MKSRFISSLAVACGIALSWSAVPTAHATNINFTTNNCHVLQNAPTPKPEPFYFPWGLSSPPTLDDVLTGVPYTVVCPLPRSPLAAGAVSGGFYVDGDNNPLFSTSCQVNSYDFTGTFLGSTSFVATESHYDRFLSLPIAQLGFWAYTNLTCTLPEDARGTLRGVTSLQ